MEGIKCPLKKMLIDIDHRKFSNPHIISCMLKILGTKLKVLLILNKVSYPSMILRLTMTMTFDIIHLRVIYKITQSIIEKNIRVKQWRMSYNDQPTYLMATEIKPLIRKMTMHRLSPPHLILTSTKTTFSEAGRRIKLHYSYWKVSLLTVEI